MIQGFRDFQHVTVAVSDIGRSLAFYRDLLGFPVQGRLHGGADGLAIDVLDIGHGAQLRLLSFGGPARPSAWQPNDLQAGLRHVGFKVRDVDAQTARLKAAGVEFTLDPLDATGDVRIAFFKDPDGTLLELVQGELRYHQPGPAAPLDNPPPTPARPLVFDHVAITVSSLDAALAFYRDGLGFPVLGQLFLKDERGFTITYLRVGSGVLEFFSFDRPTTPHPWNPDSTVLGLKHLALEVADAEAAAASLRAVGARQLAAPALFADPDGNAIELIGGVGADGS